MRTRCEIFVAAENDPAPDQTFQLIQQNFQKSLQHLYKWAADNNVSIEDIHQGSEEDFKRREKNKMNARTNETSKLANEYRMMCMDFKSRSRKALENFKQSILSRAELELQNDREAVKQVECAFKTVGWYELQLPVKITQAYIGLAEAQEQAASVQQDFNGNAKVVLIGIENSFPAWETILKYLPELEDQCWKFLVMLDRIRKRILADFPNAKSFVRPGFDEPSPALKK